MQTPPSAPASLDDAQTLLEQVVADNATIEEFLGWLDQATSRARALDVYYRGQGQADLAAVLAQDPEAVTPPVANEDAAWEALADSYDRMLSLLRAATAVVTAPLDA